MTSNITRIVGKTLGYERTLPSLPVPQLKQTCAKYLESVRPCVSKKEFAITKNKVEDFCRGGGPILQKKLEERASQSKNWLEQWWEEVAYLKPRYPIAPMINVSGPVMLHEDIWPALEGTQIKRTAIMLYYLLNEWKLLHRQEFPVDGKDFPLSMSQYYNLMSWCRIPQRNIDTYVAGLEPAPGPTAKYITVITKGRIYKCEVLNSDLEPVSILELETQLTSIVDDAAQKPDGPGLGSLTGENRDTWAKERDHLVLSNPYHWELLGAIQNSLLTVVLEDSSPSCLDELQMSLNCGNCKNRWFDKSFQLIVFKNGLMGTNLDHLAFDAVIQIITVLRAADNLKEYWSKKTQSEEIKTAVKVSVAKPTELEFKLDDRLHQSIKNATLQFEKMSSAIVIRCLLWKEYGKTFIKQHRIHPDTYVQMAIQLADYKMHKRVAPTYETASTRQFYHGRTETVRSHTAEAKQWCQAMQDNQSMTKGKVELLRIACLKHDELMSEATNGLGVDRHLLGLKILAEDSGLPTPEIFTDSAWTKSGGDGNYVLSTSLLGYRPVFGATWPMVEDGYGSFYSIQNDRINISGSAYRNSKVTDCEKFLESLKESLSDMQIILTDSKL